MTRRKNAKSFEASRHDVIFGTVSDKKKRIKRRTRRYIVCNPTRGTHPVRSRTISNRYYYVHNNNTILYLACVRVRGYYAPVIKINASSRATKKPDLSSSSVHYHNIVCTPCTRSARVRIPTRAGHPLAQPFAHIHSSTCAYTTRFVHLGYYYYFFLYFDFFLSLSLPRRSRRRRSGPRTSSQTL